MSVHNPFSIANRDIWQEILMRCDYPSIKVFSLTSKALDDLLTVHFWVSKINYDTVGLKDFTLIWVTDSENVSKSDAHRNPNPQYSCETYFIEQCRQGRKEIVETMLVTNSINFTRKEYGVAHFLLEVAENAPNMLVSILKTIEFRVFHNLVETPINEIQRLVWFLNIPILSFIMENFYVLGRDFGVQGTKFKLAIIELLEWLVSIAGDNGIEFTLSIFCLMEFVPEPILLNILDFLCDSEISLDNIYECGDDFLFFTQYDAVNNKLINKVYEKFGEEGVFDAVTITEEIMFDMKILLNIEGHDVGNKTLKYMLMLMNNDTFSKTYKKFHTSECIEKDNRKSYIEDILLLRYSATQ
jgi:hypothetical protein